MNGYYCYVSQGEPVIKEEKPENFESLPFWKFEMAPNITVAGMIYESDLRTMRLQKDK